MDGMERRINTDEVVTADFTDSADGAQQAAKYGTDEVDRADVFLSEKGWTRALTVGRSACPTHSHFSVPQWLRVTLAFLRALRVLRDSA
jgi:hypothetical protein